MAAESLRYIKFDYQSHKDALLQRVRSRWPQLWNDFLFNGQSSFATLIVDLMAWSTAALAFAIHRQAGENFISTMTLRESAQRIGSLVGYNLKGPSPATVQCQAALVAAAASDVTILKDTLVRTNDGLVFEVTEDFVIVAGDLTPDTPIVTLSINETGANVLATNVSVQNGSPFVDLIDSTINISDFVEVNQSVQFTVPNLTQIYTITAIGSADASGVNNRLTIDPSYSDATAVTAAQIAECRVFDSRITLIQGQTITDKFVAPTVSSPSWTVKLSQTPVIDNSVTVEVNGISWTQVASLFLASSTGEVFAVKTLTSGTTVVQFGDDAFGVVIPTEATVVVSYRVGGGVDGNIATNTINTSISGFISGFSNPVTILIRNATSDGQGGLDAETVEQARSNIPFFTRTNDRAVTIDDYQTLAQSFSDAQHGSVAYARATNRNENSLLEGNIVVVYAWTKGSGDSLVPLSSPLKAALKSYLQTKAIGTDFVLITDGTEQPAKISLRFKVAQGFDLAETESFVEKTLRDLITPLRPGSTIIYSDLLRAIDSTLGVDNVAMATPITDLIPSNPTELFTVPREDFVFSVDRTFSSSSVSVIDGSTISVYTAQLPVAPLAVWSVRIFMGSFELTVLPDAEPGFARLVRTGVLSVSEDLKSRINLLTGKTTLAIKGVQGDLTMRLVPIQGYDRERSVNIFAGFTGTVTQAKRREIRAALRNWSEGLKIGGTIYAQEVDGVVASKANIKSVVSAVAGVTGVTRVALESPSSSELKVTAAETELMRLGVVVLNNSSD
jgi:hypothetical protein